MFSIYCRISLYQYWCFRRTVFEKKVLHGGFFEGEERKGTESEVTRTPHQRKRDRVPRRWTAVRERRKAGGHCRSGSAE